LGSVESVLRDSPIAPPLVELARILQLESIPLSIREFRKSAPQISLNPVKPVQPSGEENQKVLKLTDVVAAYEVSQRQYALSAVNLDLFGGQVVALMGRNGAGKTTLLKCTVGQAPIVSGQVDLMGRNPAELDGKELIKLVGYVPQEPTDLLYGQSIYEECELADSDNQVPSGTTLKIYESLMRIPNFKAHPRDISEGQRLGLALSIILSAQPQLIVLDEPTRGLDYAAKKVLVEILKRIAHEEKRAVFISTHDVELVAEVADRVIFLAEGEVIADGATKKVLTASPAFAPQVAKALPDTEFLTVAEVQGHLNAD
ncbi:MAG: ATP-binding cassette domain-containing protein, partial [Candidatus Nanopelagicaceae bacterium]|nr:ATP-binding cassette domain-containing protein [Candidatus Nanopelagicaceae bacterium]